jgi:tRNA dimethylallyltransferase
MDAARFATLALAAIGHIAADGRTAFVVGGSGLYLQALTAGLPDLPAIDPAIRQAVRQLPPDEMLKRLAALDPASVAAIDTRNPRRIIRRLELCLQSGRPASELLAPRTPPPGLRGVVILPERAELHRRIAADVASRLSRGAIEEVRAATGTAGETARQILGWREISDHLAGRTTLAECHEKLTVATRQYAKRQLTWFRGKSTFHSIEISPVTTAPIERIARLAGLS